MFGWILKTEWDIDRVIRYYAAKHAAKRARVLGSVPVKICA